MHGLNVLRGTGLVSDVRVTAVERWRARVRPVLRSFSSALSPEHHSSNTLVCATSLPNHSVLRIPQIWVCTCLAVIIQFSNGLSAVCVFLSDKYDQDPVKAARNGHACSNSLETWCFSRALHVPIYSRWTTIFRIHWNANHKRLSTPSNLP